MALEEQGKTDEAIEHYRRAAQIKPDDASAQAQLADALLAKGATQEGLTYLSKAVDLDPANTTRRCTLATTLARLNQHNQAIAAVPPSPATQPRKRRRDGGPGRQLR